MKEVILLENESTVNALNQLIQGEHMAVEAYNIYISKLNDEDTRNKFNELQNIHRNNIANLASFIQSYGGQPKENIGFKGTIADMKLNMELGNHSNNINIIDNAIKGMTNGINMAEKVLRGNLDDQSRKLTEEILDKDRKAIDELKKLKH